MIEQPDSVNTYQCAECGLHFQDEAVALQCASWCKEHKSCNLDITKLSIERTTGI